MAPMTQGQGSAPHDPTTAWQRTGLALLLLVLCTAVFFRHQLLDGFTWVLGDVIDTRIEVTILEHWFGVFRGLEAWREPLYFSPTPDVLGYNDGYLLYALPYAALRAVGVDPFLAAELVHVAMRATGFVGALLFCRRVCGLGFGWALLGAVLFTLSNAAFMQASHAQLLTVGLAPLLGWLVAEAAAALLAGRARAAACWGGGAALLFDAWLMTAFYTLWFTVLLAALAAVAWLLRAAVTRDRAWRAWLGVPRWPVALAAAMLVLGAVPFVLTYAPSARATGMHPFAEALGFTVAPLDLLHVGPGNLLWGGADQWLTDTLRPGFQIQGESLIGIPYLLLALGACGAAMACRRGVAGWQVLAVTTLVAVLLCLRLGHFSAWRWVYALVPGAPAVRVVSRIMLLLCLPVILLAMHAAQRLTRRWPRAAIGLLALLLVGEQLNAARFDRLHRPREMAYLRAVPPPPADCTAFFVAAPRPPAAVDGPAFLADIGVNVDGMLLAEWLHLPTVNGHASFVPAGFALGYANQADYAARLRAVVEERDPRLPLCGLDPGPMRWSVVRPERPDLAPGERVVMGLPERPGADYIGRGWSGAEPAGRWTDGRVATLGFTLASPADMTLTLQASAFTDAGLPGPVDVVVNGRRLARWQPAGPPEALRVAIPAAVVPQSGLVQVRLDIAAPHRPGDSGPVPDMRALGLFVQSISLAPSAPPGGTAAR